MEYYVYSTLSQNMGYALYSQRTSINDLQNIEKIIYIKGGAGVMPRSDGKTPSGVRTKITQEEHDALMKGLHGEGLHPVLKNHIDRGFIIIQPIKANPAKVSRDMTARDHSAQWTREDYVKQGLTPMD